MSEVSDLRERAAQLRAAAETARDPAIASALKEVAEEFELEAKTAAVDHASRDLGSAA